MKAALAAAAAATVAIAVLLARRRRLRAKKLRTSTPRTRPSGTTSSRSSPARCGCGLKYSRNSSLCRSIPVRRGAAARRVQRRADHGLALFRRRSHAAVAHGLFASIRAAAAAPDVRVLGCCFGAQAVAVALGGAVGANPDGRFCYGVEIALDGPRVRALPEALPDAAPARIARRAGDAAAADGRAARLVGGHAARDFRRRRGNVLCVQAHPEFTPELMGARIAPALRDKGRLSAAELEERAGRHARAAAALRARVQRVPRIPAG